MATWKTVQKIAATLPVTEEGTSYGTPAFKVKGKLFVRMREEGDTIVVWTDERESLLAGDPDVYCTTPHYDGHPIVLIRLAAITEKELREMLTESWRLRAPAKVLKDNPGI